jgi:hypothetical protein
MNARSLILALGLSAAALGASAAQAGQWTYEYAIKHAKYGDVGTYTNIVDEDGDRVDVTTRVHVLVRVLGMTVYRQDAERIERWQGNRLIAFNGVTDTNGKHAEVRGQARGDTFVIETPRGTAVAPAYVRPSNPWSAHLFRGDAMMSTTTGRVFWPRITEQNEMLTVAGRAERLRRVDVIDEKHQVVWFDAANVPVAFRTEEDGTTVDFVLVQRRASNEPQQRVSAAKPAPSQP